MLEIRKATPLDAEDILEYCKFIGAETNNLTFGAEGLTLTVEEEQEYLKSAECSDKQLFLVAVYDDKIVGTATFSGFTKPRLAHRGEIGISVKKSMWGNHIGSRFMEEIIHFAKYIADVKIISLSVRSDNEQAIALYKKYGFEKIGTFDGFMNIDGENVSCDIMCLSL